MYLESCVWLNSVVKCCERTVLLPSFIMKLVERREFRGAFASFKAPFSKFFGEILDAAKPVYKVLSLAT